jgi:fatty acid synthase
MVDDSEKRWKHTNAEIPKRMGKVSDLEKFDATFFGVHFKQAHTMDPQCRLLIEVAYEAILDAGLPPKSLRGSRCGVFVGACFAESEKTWFYEKMTVGGFGITGYIILNFKIQSIVLIKSFLILKVVPAQCWQIEFLIP